MSTCVLCVMYGICLCVFGVCMCVWYMVYVHTYVYAHVCGEGVDVVIVYAYMCVWYMVHMYMCRCAHMQRPEKAIRCLPLSCSTLHLNSPSLPRLARFSPLPIIWVLSMHGHTEQALSKESFSSSNCFLKEQTTVPSQLISCMTTGFLLY